MGGSVLSVKAEQARPFGIYAGPKTTFFQTFQATSDTTLLRKRHRGTSTSCHRGQSSSCAMPRDVFPPPRILLLFLSVIGASNACLQDPASAYRLTGAVCRLTYPAAVVREWDFTSKRTYLVDVPLHAHDARRRSFARSKATHYPAVVDALFQK